MNGQYLFTDHVGKVIVAYFGPLMVAVLFAQAAPTVSLVAFALTALVMGGLLAIDVWGEIH